MKKETVPVRNSLLLLLTATIWGIAFVAQSVSMDYIGGFTFNSIRSLIGSLTLLPVILLLSKPKSAEEKKKTTDIVQSEDPDHGRYLLWHHSLPGK